MLENVKYNLEREYKFYATIPLRGTAFAIKRNSTQKTQHSSRTLLGREKKKDNMLNIFTLNRPSDRGGYERSPGAALDNYDTAGRLQCTQPTVGK